MSFYNIIDEFRSFDFEKYLSRVSAADVEQSLQKEKLNQTDFLNLLSEKAEDFLEPMARKAHDLTVQYFGRTIALYLPIYISSYCENECIYCGFNRTNKFTRKKLSLAEIEAEAVTIAKTQMKHILLLTGESRKVTPVSYLTDAVAILRKHFTSIGIEIFPMDIDEYRLMNEAGVDSLTVYQEVYDEKVYARVHPSGKKADYRYRLDAPERGAQAGFRAVNIGALLGLAEKRREAFLCGLHAKYLEDKYLNTEISLSLPRLNPAEGGFKADYPIDDKVFVQFMLAFRLFLPRVGINLSTRETAEFRDNLLPLGVTRYSAGSCTEVGGYSGGAKSSVPQFEISDTRSAEEIIQTIKDRGFQPLYKDWDILS